MKPLRFHLAATAELDEAMAWYESELEGLGDEFLSEVKQALGRVQRIPGLHAVYRNTGFRKCVLRRFPFNIFYAERDSDIWVIAVAHQKRKPDYWTRRGDN